MLYSEYHRNVFLIIAVSFFLFLVFSSSSYSQTKSKAAAIFVLKGNTILASSGKPVEGVELKLKKNGQTDTVLLSGKRGKYYLQMDVSTTDKNNEYLLYISMPGMVPKTVSLNTYISQEEFNASPFPRYDYSLEIKMTETTDKDIVVGKASARINWDSKQRGFAFDQTYATVTKTIEDDPNKFLADKKKKEEEEAARKKADEEARLKAEADAKALADQKSKDDADRIVKKHLAAVKAEMRRKRMQDSLDSIANNGKAVVQIVKLVKPISADDVDENAFDGTSAYSINIARRSLKMAQEKMNREKADNLSAKYETNNTLTSLLNVVDEDEKNQKSLVKSTKQ